MSISNVLESFDPIVRQRNYAPTRTFVTKWDIEIDRNRIKKINRGRDRDYKYFDDFDYHSDSLPPMPILCEFENTYDCGWELESDEGEGEQFRQTWLRSVYAENAYYERKYPTLELTNDPVSRKRFVHFDDDQSLFKRGRL
jgi:hypothetical protein